MKRCRTFTRMGGLFLGLLLLAYDSNYCIGQVLSAPKFKAILTSFAPPDQTTVNVGDDVLVTATFDVTNLEPNTGDGNIKILAISGVAVFQILRLPPFYQPTPISYGPGIVGTGEIINSGATATLVVNDYFEPHLAGPIPAGEYLLTPFVQVYVYVDQTLAIGAIKAFDPFTLIIDP